MKYLLKLYLLIFTVFIFSSFARPVIIQYSTFLTDANKKPRTDIIGRTVYFRLYNAVSAGTLLWSETQTVTSANGFVSVALGAVTPIPLKSIDTASALWLEMELAAETAFPRQKITTSFYSISANFSDSALFAQSASIATISTNSRHAYKADSLGNRPASDYALIGQVSDSSRNAKNADSLGGIAAGRYVKTDASGNVGIGNTSPGNALYILSTNIPQLKMAYDTDRYLILSHSLLTARSTDNQSNPLVFTKLGSPTTDRYIAFQTGTQDAVGTEWMRICSNGNVGVGTTTPSEKLEVNGRIIPTPAYGEGNGFGKAYSVSNGGSTTVFLYSNSLYRITIKSSLASSNARLGEYIVTGLNKGAGANPEILTIKESGSIDWSFSYSLNGTWDTNMTITSLGWGDQGLKVIVEQLY